MKENDQVEKIAAYYDHIGREFFQKTAGIDAKGGFLGLVKKIMGKIKSGGIKGRKIIRTQLKGN
jgi:hypothetical protein